MHGKKSVKFRTNIGLGEHALVVTSGKGCHCQKNCLEDVADTKCVSLGRYQGSSCGFISEVVAQSITVRCRSQQ